MLKRKPLETNYTLCSHQLEVVDHVIFFYLRVKISNDLSWNQHVNKGKVKANRTL